MLPILSSLPFDASDVHLRVTPTGGDEVSVQIETQGALPVELIQLVYRSLSNDWAAVTYPGALGMLRITHSRNPVPADVERPAYVTPTTLAAGMKSLRTHLNALTLQILTDVSLVFRVFRNKVHVIEEGLSTELKYRAVPMALKREGLLGSTRLSLSAIKQELAALRRKLDLSNNQLIGLPTEIWGLTSLRKLSLSNNQLTEIPPDIGRLSELDELNLSNNRLRALPAEIGRLTKLRKLYLKTNQLSEIPPSIRALPVLGELDVQGNNLISGPRFRVTYDTGFGNHIAVCGIGRGLSSWDEPVRLENVGPDQWVLPEERCLSGTSGEGIMDRLDGPCTYKFVLIEPGQVHVGSRGDGDQVVVRGSQHGLFRTDRITWERGPNRTLDASEHRTEVPSFHT